MAGGGRFLAPGTSGPSTAQNGKKNNLKGPWGQLERGGLAGCSSTLAWVHRKGLEKFFGGLRIRVFCLAHLLSSEHPKYS